MGCKLKDSNWIVIFIYFFNDSYRIFVYLLTLCYFPFFIYYVFKVAYKPDGLDVKIYTYYCIYTVFHFKLYTHVTISK